MPIILFLAGTSSERGFWLLRDLAISQQSPSFLYRPRTLFVGRTSECLNKQYARHLHCRGSASLFHEALETILLPADSKRATQPTEK